MICFRTWMFDDRQSPLVACLLTGLLLPGCAIRGNNELLEAQLRRQETVIRQYERQTSQLKDELALSQREIDLMRADLAANGALVSAEETTRSLGKATGLVFNSLLSAGQDRDEITGDERFHAVIYPHDAQGEVVKLSGHLEVEAVDLAGPAEQKSIGRWEYTPEQARELWHAGFLTSGFQVEEAWKRPPVGSKILLFARLTTTDGRKFEATQTIPIDPMASPVETTPPQSLPQPAKATAIDQVSFEAPTQSRRVPEPELWEFETKATATKTRPIPAAAPGQIHPLEGRPVAEVQGVGESPGEITPDNTANAGSLPHSGQAPPFPSGVQTSDSWTDETIPVVR